MPPTRLVLLVEDDEDQVGSWKADVREFNGEAARPFEIELLIANSLGEAKGILARHYIDAAIVDLRIPGEAGGNIGSDIGNAAVKQIVATVSGPTALFSAHVGEAAPFIASTPVRPFNKDAGQPRAIIDWFCDHAQLMTALSQTVSDIRSETAKVFAGAIWPRWEKTKALALGDEKLRQIVTRQVAAHIGEQLSLPLNNSPEYHPMEFYFEPPLRSDRLHTGDLLELEDGVYVILTAQCDMVRDYPEKILMAKCKDLNWNAQRDKKKYATQSHSTKSHFLPACGERGPWTADFKCLATMNGADADGHLSKRFASIAPQFVPNLVQRFSAFVGRIGQPELSV